MHRCSRAPELTSSATDRATHHQSVTDSTARQSSSHQLLLRKVQHGTARRGTVLHHAASPASPVDGTNALPPPRIVSSYRPTPGHLQLHMLRGTAHPNLFGPLSYPTAPEFAASSLAPRLSESVRLRLAVLTFGTVRYIVVQVAIVHGLYKESCLAQTPFTFGWRTQRRRIVLTRVSLREQVTGLELRSFGVWRTLASRGPLRRRCRPCHSLPLLPKLSSALAASTYMPPHTEHAPRSTEHTYNLCGAVPPAVVCGNHHSGHDTCPASFFQPNRHCMQANCRQ